MGVGKECSVELTATIKIKMGEERLSDQEAELVNPVQWHVAIKYIY